MSFDNYFKQLRVSSVKDNEFFGNDPKNNFNSSIIDEINLLQNQNEGNSGAVKIQSFIYAQQDRQERVRQINVNSYFCDQFGEIIPPIGMTGKMKAKSAKQQLNNNNRVNKQISEQSRQIKQTYNKKSIKEELEEQNKLLQERLKANYYHKYQNLPQRTKNDYLKQQMDVQKHKVDHLKQVNSNILNNQKDVQSLTKLEEQYSNSNTIKLYNFIMRVFPICQNCKSVRDHITSNERQVMVVCKKCCSKVNKNQLHPLIGVICDLQNKRRFEQETSIFESIIDQITVQIQKLQTQINKLDHIKQKVSILRNINRKKYKEINNSKFYIRKSLDDFDSENVAQLQKIIPKQFIDQMEGWKEIKQLYQQKWQPIYQQIYKLIPLYLHDHKQSKLLSGLHKILNYEKDQGFRLSVSQHIKFPIKKVDSLVFMVDGTYNLPVFDNVKHLTMQFHNKKTQRELSMLFTNFPRQIYSLNFDFNHKFHSHISAQSFPFLEYLAPIDSIKKISIKIQNMKEFKDIIPLSQIITPKIDFKLILTKHLFSRQQLILPERFYIKLFELLGSDLVRFQVQLPQSVKSLAFVNYEVLIQKHKLCFFQLKRGEKDEELHERNKILQDSSEQIMKRQKKKQIVFKRLICRRLSLLKMIKSIGIERIEANRQIVSLIEEMF